MEKSRGFQIRGLNGYTLSIGVGGGHYCDNYDLGWDDDFPATETMDMSLSLISLYLFKVFVTVTGMKLETCVGKLYLHLKNILCMRSLLNLNEFDSLFSSYWSYVSSDRCRLGLT